MTVELYLMQKMITDSIWGHFSRYTTIMVLLSIVLLLFREFVQKIQWVLVVPALAYVFFVVGSYRSLKRSLDELEILRGQAIYYTGWALKGLMGSLSIVFQIVMAVVVLAIYGFAWYGIL